MAEAVEIVLNRRPERDRRAFTRLARRGSAADLGHG
jgi:hypothetical protein